MFRFTSPAKNELDEPWEVVGGHKQPKMQIVDVCTVPSKKQGENPQVCTHASCISGKLGHPITVAYNDGTLVMTLLAYYEFNQSLELSLLPYVEIYHSSTYFFCAPQLTTRTILVGSW